MVIAVHAETIANQLEEAQEQAEREAAAQHEQEADRQAAQDNRRVKMALALQWHGGRLLPGEHCES